MGGIVRLAFTGDILSYQCQNIALYRVFKKYEYDYVFQDVKPLLKDADYVCGSLETPVSDRFKYTSHPVLFNSPKTLLTSLKRMGFDMLTIANNHCLDRGVNGLKDTIEALNECRLDYTGARIGNNDFFS